MTGDQRLLATGDSLVSQDPLAAADSDLLQLLREGDVRFTNLEGVVRGRREGTPAAESGGTWVGISPGHAAGLVEMGFNAFATAHNHALDWGHDGLLAQLRHLDALEAVHAGTGCNLAEARAPTYLDTAGGRVGLVSASTSFHDWNRAGATRRDCGGRPGISGIRVESELTVPPEEFAMLSALSAELKLNAADELREKLGFRKPPEAGTLRFFGKTVRRGASRAYREQLNPQDVSGVLAAIKEARRQAGRVMFSIHSHQMGNGRLDTPPAWLRDLARQAVEAGADAVLGHGPHILRGLELMEGRPVLYSLGNFIFQNETQPVQPADQYEIQGLSESSGVADLFDRRAENGGFAAHRHYWETVVADIRWTGDRLQAVHLHPVELGFGLSRSQRGQPQLVRNEDGRTIIDGLSDLSAPFNTQIDWNPSGWGEVRLPDGS